MKIKCLETEVINKRVRLKRVIEQNPRGNLIEQYGINCATEKRRKYKFLKHVIRILFDLYNTIVWCAQLKTDIWKK